MHARRAQHGFSMATPRNGHRAACTAAFRSLGSFRTRSNSFNNRASGKSQDRIVPLLTNNFNGVSNGIETAVAVTPKAERGLGWDPSRDSQSCRQISILT
jgi:hypothetical protein